MSKIIYNGQEYDCDDKHSCKDYTGLDWANREKLDGLVIQGSCFSQEIPDRKIFPPQMAGVTFIECNLDNCQIPAGNIVLGGTKRKFKVQNDGEDWIVDDSHLPIEPVNKKYFEMLKLSTDPKDIPAQKDDKAATQKRYLAFENAKDAAVEDAIDTVTAEYFS